MARINEKELKQIKEMVEEGISGVKIAAKLGLKTSTVAYQIKKLKEADSEETEEEEEQEEQEEEVEEDEDMDYWKTMAEYWKEKYLDLHSQHIVLVDSLSDE